jgi:hypothetical protein
MYFGTIVPSTFSAKAGDSFFSTEWITLIRSLKLFLSGNPVELCFIILASILLTLSYRKNLKRVVSRIARSEFVVITAWIILFYLYYILKNVTILSRYSLILLPLVFLLTMFVFTKMCQQFSLTQRTSRIVLIGLATLSILFHGLFTYFIVKPDADSFVDGFQKEYRKIASILSAEHCKDGAVIVSEVGIIGVYSSMKILDFVGLVDKDKQQFSTKREYFFNKKPQYLISRGEVTITELKDSSVLFKEIYLAKMAGFGINKQGGVTVHVYKVSWDKSEVIESKKHTSN